MPGPPHLPTEILREIFSSLSCVDLGKACLASHRFNKIAAPFLYHAVDLGRDTIDDIEVPYFLRAVLSRPDLAEYVNVLRLRWLSAEERTLASSYLNRQDESDITLFTAAAESVGLSQPPFSRGSQIILLLHILPNLHEFDIADSSACNIFGAFLESTLYIPAARLPTGLQSISRFTSDWRSGECAITPRMLVALFMLPVISAIDVSLECSRDETGDLQSLDLPSRPQYYGSSSVTESRFHSSNFSTTLLSTILQLPRALTHFTYDDGHPYTAPVEMTTFAQAMEHLRPTLQYLCLGWIRVVQAGIPSQDNENRKTIGCLRDWPVLRTIKCPFTALVGIPAPVTPRLVDVLPTVITELLISRRHAGGGDPLRMYGQWTVGDMTDKIVELVEEKEVCGFRDLTRLTVHTNVLVRQGVVWVKVHGMQTEQRLGAACIAHGVVGLQIVVDPIED